MPARLDHPSLAGSKDVVDDAVDALVVQMLERHARAGWIGKGQA
jgi:hypothetical protein